MADNGDGICEASELPQPSPLTKLQKIRTYNFFAGIF